MFALGVFAFMMCFQKPPFESRLSAISKQYFLPEDHSYSLALVEFIERCFTSNPALRPSAAECKAQLQQLSKIKRVQTDLNTKKEWAETMQQLSFINEGNLNKHTEEAETGLIDKIMRIYK